MPIPSEVLNRVKQIELFARKKVNSLFSGEYHTLFKGQGMTFSDFREYVPGDDVRTISWVVTARTNKTFVKQFEEERELTVIIAVDMSGSTAFGSGSQLKAEVMSYLTAILALSATKNKDQVGLLLFSDQVEHYVPAKKGQHQVLRLLRDIEFIKPKSQKTDLRPALSHLNRVLKKRALIFMISDFLSPVDYSEDLRMLSRKHEVISLIVEDPWEMDWPSLGLTSVEDQETGEEFLVDTDSYLFRESYAQWRESEVQKRSKILKRAQVDSVVIPATDKWMDSLVKYFSSRKRSKK